MSSSLNGFAWSATLQAVSMCSFVVKPFNVIGNLRTTDAEPQGRFGRRFILAGQKREKVFILWNDAAG